MKKNASHTGRFRRDAVTPDSQGVREAIRAHLLKEIQEGLWPVGSKLPTEMMLAQRFGTSRSNANQAIKALEAEGIVRRYRRKGTFVARALSTVGSPGMAPAARPKQGRVHIITPLGMDDAAMQWKHAALAQIESSLNQAGMQTAHLSLVNHPTIEAFTEAVEATRSEQTQGLIILTSLIPSEMQGEDHETRFLPFTKVLLSHPARVCWLNHGGIPLTGWPFDAVCLSPFDEGCAVGQYLREQGASDVLCLERTDVQWSRMRAAGLRMIAQSWRQPANLETRRFEEQERFEDICDEVLDRVAADASRRLTVVPPNDIFAATLLDRARQRGIACPKQFCVVSFGNDNRFRSDNITTVAPQASQIGEVISQLVTNQVRRPAGAAIHMTLKSIIIERLTFAMSD